MRTEVVLSDEIKSQLDIAVENYYSHNQTYKSAEHSKKMYGDLIKQLLSDNDITKYTSSDGTKVSVTTINKPTFCEDQLIPYLKELNIPNLIKTREYVDMEALEDAIYHNQIDAKSLTPFKEDHIQVRLNCSKSKVLVEKK